MQLVKEDLVRHTIEDSKLWEKAGAMDNAIVESN